MDLNVSPEVSALVEEVKAKIKTYPTDILFQVDKKKPTTSQVYEGWWINELDDWSRGNAYELKSKHNINIYKLIKAKDSLDRLSWFMVDKCLGHIPNAEAKTYVSITIHDKTFYTKKSALDYCRNLAETNTVSFNGENYSFVRALLTYHPNSELKIGCGLAYLGSRVNEWKNGSEFYFERTDGSIDNISYYKVIDYLFAQSKIANRNEVNNKILRDLTSKVTTPSNNKPTVIDYEFELDNLLQLLYTVYGINEDVNEDGMKTLEKTITMPDGSNRDFYIESSSKKPILKWLNKIISLENNLAV